MDDATTLKYTPKASQRDYNTFTEEYFSGADVSLVLGEEKVSNVSGLQYSISEQLKPMYGYASRTYDDVATGTRIVIGSFKVPISNPEKSVNPTGSNTPAPIPTADQIEASKPTRPSWVV